MFCCEQMDFHTCVGKFNFEKRYHSVNELIFYSEKFDEYGLPIYEGGGGSYLRLTYCPWCGIKLPESKRMEWFDKLRNMGYESPLFDDSIPEEFKTKAWRENKTD